MPRTESRHLCSRRAWVAPLLATLALLSLSCASGPLKNLNIISTEDEIKLGTEFSAEVEKQAKMIEDPQVQAYVDSLGQILARNSERTDIPYHIKVVNTVEVNAFALPGGYLYVNRGLIEAAATESELAGVMGHEIGHIVGRHGAKQMSRQYGISFVLSLALGQNPAFWQEQVAGLLATGALLRYGRDAELEADHFGVTETYASGIDPHGISTFFQKLLDMHDREPKGLELLFSTHPPTTERIEKVNAEIGSLASRHLTQDAPRFHAVQARLKAMPPAPDAKPAEKK